MTTRRSAGEHRSQTWRLVARSAGARLLVLPVSAILGIVNTRLIIGHFGEGAYAQYGLLVGIGALLPFADLGMTAAIMNSVGQSDDPSIDPNVRRVLITALRVLIGSCSVLLLVALLISVTGSWRQLLGDGLLPHSGPVAAALCLVVIALTMLVGFGQRILAGLGKNHLSIILLGLQTPLVLVAVLLIIATKAPLGDYVAVAAYVATLILAAAACWAAGRKVRPALGLAVRGVWRLRSVRGGGVFAIAWPMLVQMVALPIAMQTDRLILSHVSDVSNLNEYNLAAQIFTPVWAVVSSAGVALWPIFARQRAKGSHSGPSAHTLSLAFGGGAALTCLGLALISPWLADKASGGEIRLSGAIIVSFAVLMVLQALKYPLGMYMTDVRGMRYQALMIVLLLPINLGLSWYLAIRWGAVGPVIGSAIGVFLCQVAANWIYVRRDALARTGPLPRGSRTESAESVDVIEQAGA
jgi:O-antigen/teichoic acid export membrane protein